MRTITLTLKGGPGSGHRGHAGRPGSVGGSVPGTIGGTSPPTDSAFKHNQLNSVELPRDSKYIEKTVKTLPQEHLDMVGSITTGIYDPGTAGSCYPLGSIDLMADRDGRRTWNASVVRHEIGHAVLYHGLKYGDRPHKDFGFHNKIYNELARAVGRTPREVATRYRSGRPRARPVKGFPTAYSQVNSHELFAESYDLYVAKPATLLKRSPQMYNYMRDKVFNGVEYMESK